MKKTDYSLIFFTSYFVTSVILIGFNFRKAMKKNSLQHAIQLEEEQRKTERDWRAGAAQLSRDLRELFN